ncbi:carboxypeptidase-like regulatory domain-containing protein [candidate division WOR-3 bacterium]|nr:carboxypeptidase-like regulatory domain-containing protein [candidate division WOR-3 bacterium]
MSVWALVTLGLFCYSVRGVVEDPSGRPLPWASVVVEGLQTGTSANENGAFCVEVPDSVETGTLVISYIGYAQRQYAFSKKVRYIEVVLRPENIRVPGVDVAGDHSLSQTERIGVKTALDQMDVYTTPGASADLFHALKSLPAFSGDADIASIAIRGGSPREVLITLNGLPLRHPFLYYQSTGGLFSLVDENSLQSVEAFAGPLPPAYGGGMSGGVLLGTRSSFDPRLSIGISMANVNLSGTHPVTGGIWLSRSYYNFLASRMPLSDEAIYPSFWTLQWSCRAQARSCYITPLVLLSQSHTELDLGDMGYDGLIDDEQNQIVGASGGWVSERWMFEATVGYARYRSDFSLAPVLVSNRDERSLFSKTSMTWYMSSGSTLMIGGEVGRDRATADGFYEGPAAIDSFRLSFECLQPAVFAAHRFSLGRLNAVYGVRPVHQQDRIVSFDPRALTEVELNESSKLRLSAGRMSQARSLDDTMANYADHVVLGIEKRSGSGKLSLDVYYKHYKSDLSAFGAEGLVQFQSGWARSWVGFTLMHGRDQNGAPLDYDVPVKLVAVLNIPLKTWALGVNCQWSVGRPYTPLAGTIDSVGVTLPVWGDENGARLPNIFRINCRITRLFKVAHYPLFFYLEAYNITDHENVNSYCYSPDYRQEKPVVFFPRMVYAGIVITL